MPKPQRLTWTLHKEEWKNCNRCVLSNIRHSVVLCRGSLPCDVMFVGESPSASDDTIGSPFSGPAGKLLDSIVSDAEGLLEEFKLKKAFTNLIGCTLKEKDGKTLDYLDSALISCSPRINDLVKLAKPMGIVMLGKQTQKLAPKFIDYDFDFSLDMIHPAELLMCDVSQRGLAHQKAVISLRDFFQKIALCQ